MRWLFAAMLAVPLGCTKSDQGFNDAHNGAGDSAPAAANISPARQDGLDLKAADDEQQRLMLELSDVLARGPSDEERVGMAAMQKLIEGYAARERNEKGSGAAWFLERVKGKRLGELAMPDEP